jgi:hypothetical protein
LAETLENFYRVHVELDASIDDKQVPITSADVTYALDQIPRITVTIPLGKDAAGNKVSVGANTFGDLPPFTSIKVYAKVQAYPNGRDAPQPGGIPVGQFLLFDGYVLQPSMQSAVNAGGGSAELQLDGFGRLGGLSGGTVLSAGSVIHKAPSGADLFMSYFGAEEANQCLTLADQIMREGLYTSISRMTLSFFLTALTTLNSWTTEEEADVSVAAAMRAYNSLAEGGELNLLTKLSATAEESFGRMVAETVSNILWDTWSNPNLSLSGGGGDLWDVLRLLQDTFIFRIVPTVSYDYLAPITAGIGGNPDNVFNPNEYSAISGGKSFLDPMSGRKMYAYITQVGLVASSFQSSPFNDGSSVTGRVGYASVDSEALGALDGGRLYLMSAPPWLIPAGQFGKNTFNPFKGVSDALSAAGYSEVGTRAAELAQFGAAIGDKTAEAYLHELLFAHRKMAIRGRFRMDIAPGNLAKIVLPSDFLASTGDVLYGLVDEVRIHVTTAGGDSSAQTEVSFSHVRTKQEHEKLTVVNHPLYDERWVGVTLV